MSESHLPIKCIGLCPQCYPWSDPAMAMFVSTPGLVEQHQRFLRDNNPLVDPIMGYGSIHRVDLHVQRVNANYSVVFWGGRGNDTGMMWSFYIARARPEGIVLNPRQFYPTHDQHVDLAAEHLRVVVETRRRVIIYVPFIRLFVRANSVWRRVVQCI
ncbi:hypothetical protein B0H11DRAFT_1137139 [Mycena galericulata]|nr:hypothetical protein B0H11DRAFT_1137139 [Mycena galericulata]